MKKKLQAEAKRDGLKSVTKAPVRDLYRYGEKDFSIVVAI